MILFNYCRSFLIFHFGKYIRTSLILAYLILQIYITFIIIACFWTYLLALSEIIMLNENLIGSFSLRHNNLFMANNIISFTHTVAFLTYALLAEAFNRYLEFISIKIIYITSTIVTFDSFINKLGSLICWICLFSYPY